MRSSTQQSATCSSCARYERELCCCIKACAYSDTALARSILMYSFEGCLYRTQLCMQHVNVHERLFMSMLININGHIDIDNSVSVHCCHSCLFMHKPLDSFVLLLPNGFDTLFNITRSLAELRSYLHHAAISVATICISLWHAPTVVSMLGKTSYRELCRTCMLSRCW